MARKKSMTVAEAGAKRWDGLSGRERSLIARTSARNREDRRRAIREAAEFALNSFEALEVFIARASLGYKPASLCAEAVRKLKEALA